ncbi:hypothetical protein [Pantoea sp. BAV 3049]|uniref:hypothetical protein n=1 Tax=Pantoea sp. BAV 3049 TaxID=2654188 RepID=UPI00131C46CB|nr:hypothetical protein [Pantoea sp. BAV 3049]
MSITLINPPGIYVGAESTGLILPGTIDFTDQAPASLLATIDLTAEALDPLVTFTGPAHWFWNKSGLLELTTAQTWPLEYRDGVATGRHEPEPQATNLQPQSRASVLGNYVKTSGLDEFLIDDAGAPDGGAIGLVPVECDVYAMSQDNGGAYLFPQTKYARSTAWQRIEFTVISTASSRLRVWIGRNSATGAPAVFLTQTAYAAAAGYAISFFTREGDGATFPAGFVQIEKGDFCTSPIVTGDATATRTASSAIVNTTGARFITVSYSNGDQDTYSTPGSSYTLPVSQRNWGARYIQLIELWG